MECIEHPRKYFFCFFFPSSFLLSIPSPLPVFFSSTTFCRSKSASAFSQLTRGATRWKIQYWKRRKNHRIFDLSYPTIVARRFLLSPPRFVSIKLLPLLQQSDNSLTYQEKYHSRNETKTREIDKREEAYF